MNDYGWRSRRGLVLVGGGLGRVRTVCREKKEIKIVNKQAATVESLIDGHRVKMSFHELREALVCAFSDRLVISEEEFLIHYEEYESTNLYFPHWEYEPFSLDIFDSSEARAEFRVDKEDIPLLVNALQVLEYFRCPQGTGKAVRGG